MWRQWAVLGLVGCQGIAGIDDLVAGQAVGGSPEPASVIAHDQDDPRGIAVDETHVYWVNRGAETVVRKPRDGTGDIETLHSE